MTYTLSQAMLYLAKTLGGVEEGVATGGSTSYLIDTNRREQAEYWAGGTLFCLSGSNAGSVDIVRQYDEAGKIYVDTKTSAFTAGNRYALAPPKFPKHKLRMAINNALISVRVLSVDDTLTTEADKEVYVLPAGVRNILRVEIASNISEPYHYRMSYGWYEIDGNLCFRADVMPRTDGYPIKITYLSPHSEVINDDDKISDGVNIDWLRWSSAVWAYRDLISEEGKDNQADIELMNEAIKQEMIERERMQGSWNNFITKTCVLG